MPCEASTPARRPARASGGDSRRFSNGSTPSSPSSTASVSTSSRSLRRHMLVTAVSAKAGSNTQHRTVDRPNARHVRIETRRQDLGNPERPAASLGWLDGAGAAIDGHHLAVVQTGGGVAGGDHGGDAVLAGDQGGVGGQGAAVGDDRGGAGEQQGPGWAGGSGDQHLAGLEAVEVRHAAHDADGAGGAAWTGRLADDRVLGRRGGGGGGGAHGVHGGHELLGEQPGWPADGQGGEQAPLPLPDATAAVDQVLQ